MYSSGTVSDTFDTTEAEKNTFILQHKYVFQPIDMVVI